MYESKMWAWVPFIRRKRKTTGKRCQSMLYTLRGSTCAYLHLCCSVQSLFSAIQCMFILGYEFFWFVSKIPKWIKLINWGMTVPGAQKRKNNILSASHWIIRGSFGYNMAPVIKLAKLSYSMPLLLTIEWIRLLFTI